jgi:hypothetical protein
VQTLAQLVGVGLAEFAAVALGRFRAGGDADHRGTEQTGQSQDLPQPHGSVLYRSHD